MLSPGRPVISTGRARRRRSRGSSRMACTTGPVQPNSSTSGRSVISRRIRWDNETTDTSAPVAARI